MITLCRLNLAWNCNTGKCFESLKKLSNKKKHLQMFNNVNNTQREVRNGLTFPSCCFAFLSRRLLNELSAQICSASSLPNEHSAQRLSAQWTLCSTNSLLSEHSAQQTLWPPALNQLHSSSLLCLSCRLGVMVDFVQAIVSPCHIVILACCQLGTL